MVTIPKTSLTVYPLCLGGNVFGWSANEAQSLEVLDAFASHGGNFIDTADVYSAWIEGNIGGESETIIGSWMKSRNNRSSTVIATKVSKLPTRSGLSAKNIIAACDDSLRRLQTDYIDIYYAHDDDQTVPLEETLEAFTKLVTAGKVSYIASSNYSAVRLSEALATSSANNFASYIGAQNRYNLLDRNEYEGEMATVIASNGLSCLPFYGLARGFLTGKYQPGVEIKSVRSGGVVEYQNDRGWAAISAVKEIAQTHSTTNSAVALAWLRAQPTVSVPIASARTVEQLVDLMPIVELSAEEIARLSAITA